MDSLPISLNLQQQSCLLVGGGKIAYRKAQLLTRAGAVVDVVAPKCIPELMALTQQTCGQYYQQSFADFIFNQQILTRYRLVIAATNDADVNKHVFYQCEQHNILVNSVDDIPHCRFMIPAIVDRSPIVISIASQGTSPVLSRQLRTQLEMQIPQGIGMVAEFSGKWRQHVKQKIPNPDQRRVFWESIYQSSIKELLLNQHIEQATHAFQQALEKWTIPTGEVYLVGAGPGDPELLTLKALRLMQQADIILYDRLVSSQILDLCRRDAEKIYVGKARSNHAVSQENINQLLVDYAQQGKRVCRLKGGDPFIFGRGGEEIQQLFAAKIPFQVVPGVTAASGCAAYAGIPLTHRDYAQSVRFLTGHLKEGSPELPWQELIYENQTLVLYMGLVGLETICQKLIAYGQREDMPVALISKGTTPEQKVVIGTLKDIYQKVQQHQISAPTLTIIGEVVTLHEQLNWRSAS